MIGSSTSWRKDWLNHDTPVTVSPRMNAMAARGGLESLTGFRNQPDEQRDRSDVLEPPKPKQRAQRDADERDRGQVGARDRLGDVGAERRATDFSIGAPLGQREERHDYEGCSRDRDAENRAFGFQPEQQAAKRRCDDVGAQEDQEHTRDSRGRPLHALDPIPRPTLGLELQTPPEDNP